ncbi:MAG: hypothetical protein AAF810_13970 [Cyanobacteria bacterium P01_D01_bin.36]
MKTFLSSRLIPSLAAGITSQLVRGASAVQHLCMKTAVAVSLKLCLFTARVLLNSSARGQAGRAF